MCESVLNAVSRDCSSGISVTVTSFIMYCDNWFLY